MEITFPPDQKSRLATFIEIAELNVHILYSPLGETGMEHAALA